MLLAISSMGRPVGCSTAMVQAAAKPGHGVVEEPVDGGRRPQQQAQHQRAAEAEGEHGQDAERDAAVHLLTVSPPTDTHNQKCRTRMPG